MIIGARTPGDLEPTPETQAFWEAAAQGRFLVRHCNACDKAHWYPRGLCPLCHSGDTDWREGSGKGTIYSFSVMRKAEPPFVMAYVTLAEGPTMMTNIVECETDELRIGQPVELVFQPSKGGTPVPCFPAVDAGMTDAPRGLLGGLTNYGDAGFSRYLRRSFASSMGYSRAMLDKPIVGICYAAGGFNNCHRGVPDLIEAVKRGVLAAGALPIDFPTISLGEVFLSPTSLKYRNLMSMDVEEMIRAQPMDSVVLIGGCDKTVPAQLMGAASADLPAIQLVTGPMSTGRHRGERIGACTDCRRFWARYRADEIDGAEIDEVEQKLASTAGTCAVMGTASTMAAIAEALGMMPAGAAAVPAVDAQRLRIAEETGRIAVALIDAPRRPSEIMTAPAIENALRILLAIGGSTNAILHLTAIAGRLGHPIDLHHLNHLSDTTPVLVNLKPTGDLYMEDLAAAGGIPAVMREIRDLLHLDCVTVTGETIGARIDGWDPWVDTSAIRSRATPVDPEGGLVALFGNLAPRGAILKRSAADARLFERRARAVVFDGLDDLAARIDDPALDVTADDALILRNAGPCSPSSMPEAGYIPIPRKLAQAGVKDMIRISDARMSGTAFGTVVLHVSPDAASGGPLALVRSGDTIDLSVANRRLDLLVDPAELERRRTALPAPATPAVRGHDWLHTQFITQADQGCDFTFLQRKGATQPA